MAVKALTIESTIQQKSDILLSSELGDELVMMDINNGSYISLNRMGKIIWEQIADAIKVKDLVNHLISRFDIPIKECTEDCLAYLEQMNAQNLLKVD